MKYSFYGIIRIVDTYNGDLLTDIGIPAEQFSMIFAILTFIGGISLSLKSTIEKKFKNRTLSFIGLSYVISCVIIGFVSTRFTGNWTIVIILVLYAIQKFSTSNWYILEYKYLKNFTNEEIRNKITFTYEFLGGMGTSIISILGGLLLKLVDVENAFLLSGLISLLIMVLVLDYMRTRFGLKPNQYTKEDIDFK